MLKKAIASAAGAALALSMGAAGAYFTAQVQVPDSIIRAGSVAISAEPTSAPLSIDSLAPGTSSVRPLTVVNTGSLPADIVVTASKKAGITDFYESLTCTATVGGLNLYSGSLNALRTSGLRLAPGARGDMRFEVGMPADADNAFTGDYAKVSLYIDAEQVH